jgi:hypothetical protein
MPFVNKRARASANGREGRGGQHQAGNTSEQPSLPPPCGASCQHAADDQCDDRAPLPYVGSSRPQSTDRPVAPSLFPGKTGDAIDHPVGTGSPAASSHTPMEIDDDVADRLSHLPPGPEAWRPEMEQGRVRGLGPGLSRKRRQGRERVEWNEARESDRLSSVSERTVK